MELLQALVLGIIQGITEFLPISSTGHLLVIRYFLGWDTNTLAFDAILHLGTLLAVLIFFRREWWGIAKSLVFDIKSRNTKYTNMKFESRLGILILVGSIPAGIIGFIFEKPIETVLHSPIVVAVSLVAVGGLMLWIDRKAQILHPLKSFKAKNAIFVGLAQSLALIPGVSRSGITMIAGMFAGLTREEAAKFSFMLATPIIMGAGLVSLLSVFGLKSAGSGEAAVVSFPALGIGVAASATVGFLTIHFLLKYLRSNTFTVFVVYRFALAAAVLLAVFLK